MTNSRWIGILAILVIAGLVFFFLPSVEKKIEKKLVQLGKYCSTSPKEATLETLKKGAGAANLCSNPCRVTIVSLNIDKAFTTKEISDHILMMKKRLPNTTFSFHDTAVNVMSKNSAEVITTLKLDGKSVDGHFVDAYEIDIEMKKEKSAWLFSSFKVVEFMEK